MGLQKTALNSLVYSLYCPLRPKMDKRKFDAILETPTEGTNCERFKMAFCFLSWRYRFLQSVTLVSYLLTDEPIIKTRTPIAANIIASPPSLGLEVGIITA